MNRKPYSSAIKKTPFKYPIAKKIAKLMLDGLDREEIYTKCFDENYIEIESPDRRREITNVIYNRLVILDDFLLARVCVQLRPEMLSKVSTNSSSFPSSSNVRSRSATHGLAPQ